MHQKPWPLGAPLSDGVPCLANPVCCSSKSGGTSILDGVPRSGTLRRRINGMYCRERRALEEILIVQPRVAKGWRSRKGESESKKREILAVCIIGYRSSKLSYFFSNTPGLLIPREGPSA
jgi:hypothetical protein